MKIIITLIFVLLATQAMAFSRNITIYWEMSDTTNVTGYIMYFYYANDPSNKIKICESTDATISKLTCKYTSFTNPEVYFQISAVTPQKELVSKPLKVVLGTRSVSKFIRIN